MATHPLRQRGATLIEALVAMLVLALGVLGMTAAQTRALVSARSTHQRAVASQMVSDLLDRIQANAAVLDAPAASHPYTVPWGEPAPQGADCTQEPCDGAQMAAFDLRQWKATLARSLPRGDAMVFPSDGDPHQIGVLVAWMEAPTDPAAESEDEARRRRESMAAQDASGQIGTGTKDRQCPPARTCHLVYIRP